MKYIRTENGVYEIEENFLINFKSKDRIIANNFVFPKGKYISIPKSAIIKQADTIEELCDEFICESNEEGNDFFIRYIDLFGMLRDDFYRKYKEHYNFYGATRVKGKGLIYVAKMNENGELELI